LLAQELDMSSFSKDPAHKNPRREDSLAVAPYVTLLSFTIDHE
jgi:hypothetical protein